MGFLERRFQLSARGTSARTEVVAGLTTFVTLSYILFVQPALLSNPACGMDAGGVLFATCTASALGCFLMGWWGNYPIALAPAMGHNVFFVFTVCAGMGFTWQEALAANLIAGLAFLALTPFRFRETVMEAIPDPLKHAIAAGIGLMIAVIGLQWGGLVVAHPAVLVQLGDLGSPPALLALFGLALTSVLFVRGVPGAILVGLATTAIAGWAAGAVFEPASDLVRLHGVVAAPPSPAGTAFHLDLPGLFSRPLSDWLAVIAVFFLLDLFDTVGTLVGVADQAGLMEDGRLPRARGALAADAAGTSAGALLGTSTITSYVESVSGVASGGRTGLTAIVCGVLFLLGLFLRPLVEAVGAGVDVEAGGATVRLYPVLAPVLILVGVFMIRAVRRIDWGDPSQAIPCFLAMAIMPLAVSITDGIAWGMISWSVLSLAGPRRGKTPLTLHLLSAVFLARYLFL